MQAKIHKAKLITLHNEIADPQTIDSEAQPTGIHAYMILLRNLINKNQPNVQSVQSFVSNESRCKVAVSLIKKKQSNCHFSLLPRNSRISKKEKCLNRQQILHSIMQGSKKLIQINSFSRIQTNNSKGNKSERIGKYRDDQYRSFVPIGKIYHQLKHNKTESAADYQIKSQLNSSASLKLENDKVQQRKRFSIYAKQTRSAQRSTFRQNRVNTERPPMELCALSLKKVVGNFEASDSRSHSPTPW